MLQLVNYHVTCIAKERAQFWKWITDELPKAHWFVYGTLIWLMLRGQDGKKGEANWD